MKSKIIKPLSYLFCISLVLTTILSVVDFCCFDKNFYKKEYIKLNIAEEIKVTDENLDIITANFLDYLKDKRDDLDFELKVDGTIKEVFNTREKLHMIDVKDLYLNVMIVRNISLLLCVLSIVIIIIKKDTSYIRKAYIKTLCVFGFIFIFIGLCCLIDFDAFWTRFHLIFFPQNDYWLLDPRESILINIVPGEFFFSLCIRIVFIILVLFVLYFILFSIRKKAIKND